MTHSPDHDPLRPHAHDPNPEPPTAVSHITLIHADGQTQIITVADLQTLPQTAVANCIIVSTGHGSSGPFTFKGVTLKDFMIAYGPATWHDLELISADGFGNRVQAHEVATPTNNGPILLATTINDQPMTRQQGLVRLIVPNERDDALRQVKWIATIKINHSG